MFGITKKGFTLVEMLVVVLIFSIVIGATIGVFVSVVRVQRYTLVAQQLLDQTSYVMEYMGRTIRMAKKDLAGDCISLKTNYEKQDIPETAIEGLMFKDYQKRCKGFFLQDNKLKEYEAERIPEVLSLTSSKLKASFFNKNLSGQTQGDDIQPRVTFLLEIKGMDPSFAPKIRIQTTISQRDLDIKE